MEIMTRDFGKININKEEIIEFPRAIPGFPDEEEFVLLPLAEESPFIVMQSVRTPEIAFITLEPGNFIEDYQFEISDQVADRLEIEDHKGVLVLAIATVKDKLEELTINLAAPVVINLDTGLGKQVILDQEQYPVKFKLFAGKTGDRKEMVK